MITASCDGLSYHITLNEDCRQSSYRGLVDPTELSANGRMSDPGCTFAKAENETEWTMSFGVDECNITAITTNDSIEYPVTIMSSEIEAEAIIYRFDPGFSVGLSCSFHRTIQFQGEGWSVSTTNNTQVTVEKDDQPKNLEDYFNFGISEQTRDAINETQVSLGQDLTFIATTNTSIDYKLTNCWATPNQDTENPLNFDLIENGCPAEDWIVYNLTQFTFPFFAFVSSPDQLYVHCEVLLCDSSSSHRSCQPTSGCSTSRKRRSPTIESDLSTVHQVSPLSTL